MLLLSFWILTAAVLLGLAVSLSHLDLMRWRWWPGAVHGAFGVAGLAVLLFSLTGAPRGAEYGVESFGAIAGAVALAAMLVALLYLALLMLAKKHMAWLIGLHAVVALTAYSFLLAYIVF